jgi:hypothetical protein
MAGTKIRCWLIFLKTKWLRLNCILITFR